MNTKLAWLVKQGINDNQEFNMESLHPGPPRPVINSPDIRPELAQESSGPPVARFGRHQVSGYEMLDFKEAFVHNVLKQSCFIHDKDDSGLIRSASTLTLTTSRYFGTFILHSVAHCPPVCQAIAKCLTARDLVPLSLLNRSVYQSRSHWNRLITSILVEQYYSRSPAMQAKYRSHTDQIFPEISPPKLTEWLKNHFDQSDKSWVEKDTLRPAALNRYLYKRTRAVDYVSTLRGHSHFVRCLTMHPDGQRLISGSYDTTLRVWDLNQAGGPECIAILPGHFRWVTCITTLLNGWVISGSVDETLRVWDLDKATGDRCINILSGHTDRVNCITTLPNGQAISGSDDKTLRVWDLNQTRGEECIAILQGHTGMVNCISTLPCGKTITGSADGTLKVWDLDQTGGKECIATLFGHKCLVSCITILLNSRIISGSIDWSIRVWDLDQKKGEECIAILSDHNDWVNCITPLPCGLFLSCSDDKTLNIWDLSQARGAECILTLRGDTRWISCIPLPYGQIVSGSSASTLIIWDLFAQTDIARGLLPRQHLRKFMHEPLSQDQEDLLPGTPQTQ